MGGKRCCSATESGTRGGDGGCSSPNGSGGGGEQGHASVEVVLCAVPGARVGARPPLLCSTDPRRSGTGGGGVGGGGGAQWCHAQMAALRGPPAAWRCRVAAGGGDGCGAARETRSRPCAAVALGVGPAKRRGPGHQMLSPMRTPPVVRPPAQKFSIRTGYASIRSCSLRCTAIHSRILAFSRSAFTCDNRTPPRRNKQGKRRASDFFLDFFGGGGGRTETAANRRRLARHERRLTGQPIAVGGQPTAVGGSLTNLTSGCWRLTVR